MQVRLLEVNSEGILTITPEALMIKEFKAVWNKYKDKNKAYEELAFIYWMGYYNSVYDVYTTEKEKVEAIKKDVISDNKWQPTEITKAAIDKFNELQRTFSMAFLEAAKEGALKIREFYHNVNLNERNKSGGVIWKPADISKAIGDSVHILESLEKWEERIKKEEELQDSKIKGGGRAGIFEDEGTATWLKDDNEIPFN